MALGSPAHATSNSHKTANNALRRNATSNNSSNNNNRARGINNNSNKSANHVTSHSSGNAVEDFLDNRNYADWGNKGTSTSSNADVMQDVSLIQQIAAKAASSTALVAPTVALTVYIPTSTVGAVIGRKGQTIAQLQKISAEKASSNHPVRISVVGRDYLNNNGQIITTQNGVSMYESNINNNTSSPYGLSSNNNSGNAGSIPYTHTELDWSNPSLTPVVIRADPAASLIAATILHDVVLKQQQQIMQQQQNSVTTANGNFGIGKVNYGQENGEDGEDGEYYSYEDDVILDVPISRHKHAAIVGKRGIVLATISADYGVRIMVPPPPLPSSLATLSSERHDIIQLEGSLSNVKRCLFKILQLASAAYNSNVGNKATDTKVDDSKNSSNSNKKTQPNGVAKNATTENASTTNVVDGVISHQKTIVLTVPITQTKLRNIGQKTDTTIRKKKKVEDGFSYAVTSSLNTNSSCSTNGTVLTIHQQKMIVENNVNAAVALLQKWNSDNLTSAATTNVAGTQSSTAPTNNPGSDSSSTGPRSPRRTNNNNRNRGNGGRGVNNNKNGPNKRGNNKSKNNKEAK